VDSRTETALFLLLSFYKLLEITYLSGCVGSKSRKGGVNVVLGNMFYLIKVFRKKYVSLLELSAQT
jgi:hypothetical protein